MIDEQPAYQAYPPAPGDDRTTSTAQVVDMAQLPPTELSNMYRQLAGALHAVARAQGQVIRIVVVSSAAPGKERWE